MLRARFLVGVVSISVGVAIMGQAPAVAEDPIIIELPVMNYPSKPIEITYSSSTVIDVSLPSGEDDTQVASQCTPLADFGLGSLCLGSTTNDPAPLSGLGEVYGLLKAGPEADAALTWMVEEGITSIQTTYDIPRDYRIERYARPELRAYMLGRILNIMDKQAYGVALTEDESKALAYINKLLAEDDRILAQAAVDEFERWQGNQCGYHPPTAPAGVPDPVLLPKKVADWCGVAHHPTAEAFMFAPPMPSVDDFTAWGGYQSQSQLGLPQYADSVLANHTAEMITAYSVLGGLGAAIFASGLAALVTAGVTAAAFAAAAAVGTTSATAVTTLATTIAPFAAKAGVAAAISSSAAAAASIVGVIVIFVVVTAVSIWMLHQNMSVGTTLHERLATARTTTDPLGVKEYIDDYQGEALNSQLDENNPPAYRNGQSQIKIANQLAEITTIDQFGNVIADPVGLWADNTTTNSDYRFRVTTPGAKTTTMKSVEVPQEDGMATIRFNDGWLLVKKPGEPVQASMDFGFLTEAGKPRVVARAPGAVGGFYVNGPTSGGGDVDGLAEKITFDNAQGQSTTVELIGPPTSFDAAPRPVAVGPLTTRRPVMLRANPVNPDGSSLNLTTAENDYDYAWTVKRLDESDGSWDSVHTASTFGTSFVPTTPGQYDARVMMTSVGNPSNVTYGYVQFEVEPPAIEFANLVLQDNGVNSLEIDLQLTEEVANDTFQVTVQWQPNVGSTTRATTTINPSCIQTGPLDCTSPATGPSNLLVRAITPNTDLRQPIIVTVTNADGAEVTRELVIDNPARPSFTAPAPDANDGLPGLVKVDELSTQVVMPLRNGVSTYVAAQLVPGTGGGTDFGLVDPGTGNTTAALPIPGTSNLFVEVDNSFGPWELLVWGTPGIQDLGTYEFPVVIQQTSNNRQLVDLVVHVVPSTLDRYRGGLQHDVNPADFAVETPPEIFPVILGGNVDWARYNGDVCVAIEWQPAGPPTTVQKCGPREWFFAADGEAQALQYEQFFPNGLQAGSTYRVTTWLVDNDVTVDNTPLTMSFLLLNAAPLPTPEVTGVTPKIKGTPKVGGKLKAVAGEWFPGSVKFTYTWFRNGKVISGAKGATYTLTGADRGAKIKVKVTGKANGWKAKSYTSASTGTVR